MMAHAAMNASSTCAVMSWPDESKHTGQNTGNADQHEPPARHDFAAHAGDRRRQREDAVDERVSAPEKDERHQGNGWPEEGQDAEGDGCDAAE